MKKYIKIAALALMALAMSQAQAQSSDWLDSGIKRLTNGVSFGYINQQVRQLNSDGSSRYSDGIWGKSDKRVHGVYFGVPIHYHLAGGFSIFSGLNMEVYMSVEDYGSWTEIAMNIPLHLQFALPLTDELVTGIRTGPALTYAFLGAYEEDGYETYYPYKNSYKRANFTYDLGFFAQFEKLRIDFIWQQGLSKWTDECYRNRFAVGFTLFLE